MERKEKSIKLNFIMNAILNMSSFLFPLITFPYVSRVLSPMGLGKVSFANSVISYFVILAQLGIPTYGIRICAKVRDDREKLTKTVQEIFMISMVMCILTYILFAAALILVPRLWEDRGLYILMSSSILFYTIGVEWLYKALEQYTYITTRSILFKFVALLAMLILVHRQEDYVIYGGISIFASAASNVLNFIRMPHIISMKPVGHYELKKHMKPVLIFFGMSCATTVYVHLDSVMLGFMKSDADVGYYNVAIKMKMILVSVITSLGTVLLPRISYYIEHKIVGKFEQITKKALNFVFLVAVPLTVYFMIFSKESVYFLAGNKYVESIVPMAVIMMTLPFIGMTNVMGIQILVPMGREKQVLYSEVTGAVVDLILNLLLIPKFASLGAAIGTLAAEIGVWCVQYYALKDVIIPAYRSIHYAVVGIALLLGGMISVCVRILGLTDFFTLLFSAILFFGIYGITLTVWKEPLVWELEQQMFNKIFRWKGRK